MSSPFDPSDDDAGRTAPSAEAPDGSRLPWEQDLPEDTDASAAEGSAKEGRRERHDAFTEARKSKFLTALVKTGCITEAAARIGVGVRTVYRHQESDPRFLEHCRTALRMSATPIELTAWSRAVEGVDQEFACGGQVHVRRRYDGSLLRLLLQGSNPKKYGPRPGFKRKRILKHERKQLERQVRAELAEREERCSFDQSIDLLDHALAALDKRQEPERFAAGWTRSSDGHSIPPGYGPIPGWQAPAAAPDGAEPPRDSM